MVSGFPAFPIPSDAAVFDADVGLHDAPVIENHGVGYDEIQRAGFCFADCGAALAHAVANYLSAAERDLVAVMGEVFFDFDDEIGVGESNAVAFGGTVEIGVGAAGNLEGHFKLRLRTGL